MLTERLDVHIVTGVCISSLKHTGSSQYARLSTKTHITMSHNEEASFSLANIRKEKSIYKMCQDFNQTKIEIFHCSANI